MVQLCRIGLRPGIGGAGRGGAAAPVYNVSSFLTAAAPQADAWTWWQEPRAISANGKTWLGTNGSDDSTQTNGFCRLYELDHATGAVTFYEFASGTLWSDDHNYPTVLIRPDGRLIAFYCPHRVSSEPIRYRISVNPYDASAWSQEYDLGNGAASPTYPSPVMLSAESNKIYVFHRWGTAGAANGALVFKTSTDLATVSPATVDGGALGATPTWSGTTNLVIGSSQGVYTRVRSNNIDRIDFVSTDAVSGGSGTKNDVRHAYMIGAAMFKTDGTSIGDTAFASMQAVATSGAPDSFGDVWVQDFHVNYSSGLIEVLFSRLVSINDHRAYYARWSGSAWSKSEIDAGGISPFIDSRSSLIAEGNVVAEGYYSPSGCFDQSRDGVIYLSVGWYKWSVLWKYSTVNGGASWLRSRVSDRDATENVRPVVPIGASDKYKALWLSGQYFFYDFTGTAPVGYTTRVKVASYDYAPSIAAPANLVQKSEQFNDAWWGKVGGSVTANATVAPDGNTTADRFTDDGSSSGQHGINMTAVNVTTGMLYTYAVNLKYVNAQWVQLVFSSAAFGTSAFMNIDIQNGAIGSIGLFNTQPRIVSVANGFFRVSVTALCSSTSTGLVGLVISTGGSAARSPTYIGSGKRFDVHGAQFELGEAPTAYQVAA